MENIEDLEFDWSHGFRVKVGADVCHNWSFDIAYTYLRPSGNKTIQRDHQIFPTFFPQFVGN